MQWLNEPACWHEQGGVLNVTADGHTDFWRITGNGAIRDNGHLYGERLTGDFDLSMRLRGSYSDETDHAGAMIRIDARSWIKTGVEFFEGKTRFSTVITNDYSDWAVAELPEDFSEVRLSLSRRNDAIEVRYAVDDGDLKFGSLVHFPSGDTVTAGAMCAAPKGNGFPVSFYSLTLSRM